MAAYAALVSLMHIIDDLDHHPHPPISLHKNQAYLITQKITLLQEFLEGYNPNLAYSTEADPLEIRIADVAYAAEDAIESHIMETITTYGANPSSHSLYKALERVIEYMDVIERETMQMQMRRSSTPSNNSPRSSSAMGMKEIMVGVDDIKLQTMEKLVSNHRVLQVIPIVCMGGTGKTTLARNIYQERLIKEHFDVSAWVTISQDYSVREIFVEIISQLNIGFGQNLSEDHHELGGLVYKHLYGKKYLIIMDDMWSIDAWDRVRNFFPDNENCSRIVVTTRLSDLASKLSNSISNCLEMELLDDANSWNLLSKTVFGEEESCPIELEEIGKKIGKSCKGLPLSIVVVEGLLAKAEHTREFWEYIEENLNSIVNLEDDERCFKILHMSYKQLPVYLKPCFLYMGGFAEDEVIRISRLAKLWVSEGILKPINGKTLEEVARMYIKELADRNVILIHKVGGIGGIKECKIHDLLRDMCLREAEERFYTVIPIPTPRGGTVNSQRPSLISSNKAINGLSSRSLARSWMRDLESQAQPQLSFRLLRILDSRRFQPMEDATFLDNVHQLVNSRFLAISPTNVCKIPCSIKLFWNLLKLVVTSSRASKFTVPTDVWHMPRIMHVEVKDLHLPDHDPKVDQDEIILENLLTLSKINNFKCSEQMVKKIPNIKKLKIYYKGLSNACMLTNLDRLNKLESLKCYFFEGRNRSGLDTVINFPRSLKRLNVFINESRCWENVLDKIGRLPLLQKLTLYGGSFKERKWETSEGRFRSLKFLVIRWCDGLHVWETESSHFPCLEHLRVERLNHLKEIPLDVAEISTLGVIEVNYCTISVVVSAQRLLEEQEELYGEATIRVQVRT